MEIVISRSKIYGDEKRTVIITDNAISFQTGDSFPQIISKNTDIIGDLFTRFFSLTYTWKKEYIGPRTPDGYKYLVTMNINHKRKTYKIQNKYPDNWDEFISLEESITDGGYLK